MDSFYPATFQIRRFTTEFLEKNNPMKESLNQAFQKITHILGSHMNFLC